MRGVEGLFEFRILSSFTLHKERCFFSQIVKDYYGKELLTRQDLMEARLIGMGPKGQRRAYKKKGSRLDAPSGRSETEPSEDDGEPESARGNSLERPEEGTEGMGVGEARGETTIGADVMGKQEETVDGRRSGDRAERAGSENGAREHSAGDGINGPGGNGAVSTKDGETGRVESERNGRIGSGRVENGSERVGAERSETEGDETERTDRAEREEAELSHNEGEPAEAEQNGADAAEPEQNGAESAEPEQRGAESAEPEQNGADSAGDGPDGLPYSRRSGIMSRRQRQRMRAELSGGGFELGAGEKGRRAEAVLGHGQHGRRVVEILEETGGEDALREFVQEWRACFVEALRPTYLPPAWDVKHR